MAGKISIKKISEQNLRQVERCYFFGPERRGKQRIDGWICFVINGLVRLLDLLIVDVLLNY